MKNLNIQILIMLLLTFLVGCKKEKKELRPTNHLQQFNKVQSQIFELGTIDFKLIKGNLGTEIYFVRDLFQIDDYQKITIELKEYYNFKELLFNNINTLTDKNELLESSGVIYLDIKADGKKINLKEKERLQIKFPNNRLNGNDLFYSTPDSLNQFKWIKEESLYVGVFHFDDELKIDILKPIRIDYLDFYRKNRNQSKLAQESNNLIIPPILINKLGWINIDKIISPDGITNFKLVVKNDDIDNVSTHIVYKNLNSFISEYRTIDSLKFRDIPIKNKTELIIIGKKESKIFADKVEIKNILEQTIEVQLKEINNIELKEFVEK